MRGQKTPGLSETDWVGTVALGWAQFGAQCCFAIIQTLLHFKIQNEDHFDVQNY
jgi:hypothetical protein